MWPATTEVRLKRLHEQPATAQFRLHAVLRRLRSSGLTIADYSERLLRISGKGTEVIMRRPSQRGNQCLGVALLGTQRPERKFMPLLSALARALDAPVFDVDWKARVDFEDPYYTSMPERPEVQRPAVWFPD